MVVGKGRSGQPQRGGPRQGLSDAGRGGERLPCPSHAASLQARHAPPTTTAPGISWLRRWREGSIWFSIITVMEL